MLGVPAGADVLERNLEELGTSGMQKLNNQPSQPGGCAPERFQVHKEPCSKMFTEAML